MMVMSTCSFTLNGPGLSGMPKTLTLGTHRAHARPMGNEISWATICIAVDECSLGYEDGLENIHR